MRYGYLDRTEIQAPALNESMIIETQKCGFPDEISLWDRIETRLETNRPPNSRMGRRRRDRR